MDAYDHLSILEAVGITPQHRIAWTSSDPRLMDRLRIIETIARNRSSLNVAMFESTAEARRWLDDDN
jgi:hypothetical protein